MATSFASAQRAPRDVVRRQHNKLVALPFVRAFLDAAPNMTVVLNDHRQIVFANRAFTEFVGRKSVEGLLGAGHENH
jgi:PAS domain-containing protein